MPGFTDRIVDALLAPLDPVQRGPAEAFVHGSLDDLPQHLGIGIALDSVLLEAWTRLTHRGRIPDDATLRALIARWESNPLTPIRQYARMLSSLVLFADQETTPDSRGAAPAEDREQASA